MEGSIWEMSAFSLFEKGGPLMIPLLLCSIFAVGIIIEKLMYFSSIKIDLPALKENVFECIKNNEIKDAIEKCDQSKAPVAKILRAGVVKFGSSRESIKESMEDASLFEIPKLESRLGALGTIAQISPLIGLLGTMTGIATCFYTIQAHAAALAPITPGDLAGGIGEALITTVAGLMVAIPSHVSYNYFVNRVQYFTLEMERAATELVNYMTQLTETSV